MNMINILSSGIGLILLEIIEKNGPICSSEIEEFLEKLVRTSNFITFKGKRFKKPKYSTIAKSIQQLKNAGLIEIDKENSKKRKYQRYKLTHKGCEVIKNIRKAFYEINCYNNCILDKAIIK
ncbi:hypothetical protein [Candidatus Pyrohabitans sp.]